MLKVMTIVGTRPEIIRLSRVVSKLDHYFKHVLVHTGQNYDRELNSVFFEELGIRAPDEFLNAAGENPAVTIGQVIISVDQVLEQHKPDAVLVLGDTNSSLCVISAKRRKIPIFHMEAGNRCFDFNVPEEINRKIVDHISDINLTYSDIAREHLLAEGLPATSVIKTGSPMKEVLDYYAEAIERSSILEQLNLEAQTYFLVSAHREDNVDSPSKLRKLLDVLTNLVAVYKLPILFSTHPRTRKRLDDLKYAPNQEIIFSKPFGFLDYIKLQMNAKCVLSDSGTITEESSILNFPALNIREVNERPEGFEEGAVMMVGLDFELIKQSLLILDDQPRRPVKGLNVVRDYNVDNVSEKVIRTIVSYTSWTKRKVWHQAS